MKKEFLKYKVVAVVLICIMVMSSCKKGEDDPVFTLASRKARVAGDWKMKSGKLVFGTKDASGVHPSYSYDFDGTMYSMVNGKGGHFDGPATLSLSFTKAGDFTIKQQLDSISFEATGAWDFQGKIGKYKNKENMTIRLNDIIGASNYYILFNKSLSTLTYKIKELRSKKLVLVSEEEIIAIDQSGFELVVTSEYDFVQ